MYIKRTGRRKVVTPTNPFVEILSMRPARISKDFWESKVKKIFEQRKISNERRKRGSTIKTPKKKPEQTKVPTLAEIKKMKKGDLINLITVLKKKKSELEKTIKFKTTVNDAIKKQSHELKKKLVKAENEVTKEKSNEKVLLAELKRLKKEFEDYKKKAYLPPEPAEKKKDTGRNATVDRFSSLELFTLDEEARDFLKTQKEAEDKKVKKK